MRRRVMFLVCAAVAGLIATPLTTIAATDATTARLSLVLLRGDSVAAALPPAPCCWCP